jgi:hypothetical protein
LRESRMTATYAWLGSVVKWWGGGMVGRRLTDEMEAL